MDVAGDSVLHVAGSEEHRGEHELGGVAEEWLCLARVRRARDGEVCRHDVRSLGCDDALHGLCHVAVLVGDRDAGCLLEGGDVAAPEPREHEQLAPEHVDGLRGLVVGLAEANLAELLPTGDVGPVVIASERNDLHASLGEHPSEREHRTVRPGAGVRAVSEVATQDERANVVSVNCGHD